MKSKLNLLPAEFGRHIIVRNCAILWVCVLFTVGSALIAYGYRQHAQLAGERSRLAKIEMECVPVRATLQENVEIDSRLDDLRGRQTLLAHLDRGRHPLQLVGLVSRSARFVGEGLKVSDMSYHITEVVEPPDAIQQVPGVESPPIVTETIRLRLEGIAANDLAVSKFILALRESGYFENVELKSSVRSKLATGRTRRFQVECTL